MIPIAYSAYITTINHLRKHSNADRLQVATIFGNDVIVDLSYEIGQRVIYFPTDGQLGKEFAYENNLVRLKDANGNNTGGYLDPDKRNIKAINLRGEKSDGLVLPIKVLEKYANIDDLKDGDQITTLGGVEICKKYIPRGNGQRRTHTGNSNKKKSKKPESPVSYEFFAQHIDTEQLAYNERAFKPGDTCYITLKMHGTSARTMNAVETTVKKPLKIMKKLFRCKDRTYKKYKVISGTRRTTLSDYDGGYYGNNLFRKKYHDFFEERLPKGAEIFYEIVGWIDDDTAIMAKCSNSKIKDKEFSKMYGDETVFSYGCETGQNDCYVYRMTLTNEDGFTVELPWEQVQIECERMGVKCVPTFEKFTFTTWDDLMQRVEKYYDGADPIGRTHIREGVVVRIDNRPKFTAYKHKSFNFRVLEGIIKDEATAPDIEEAEDMGESE